MARRVRIRQRVRRWSGVFVLLGFSLSTQAAFIPVLTEFMASNSGTLLDEDGLSSDWIEVANLGSTAGNLASWYLTDNAGNLTRWVFPDTPLAPGEHIIIFASGKDQRVSGNELHTNFELSSSGEYLALVESNGVSIATEYAPEYPPQIQDVSYGAVADSIVLQDQDSPLHYWIPTAGALGLTWTDAGFDDASWTEPALPALGIGYEISPADFVNEINTPVPSGTMSLYLRLPLDGMDVAAVEMLFLRMKYDDGFVAYLNGTEVARANAPVDLNWDSLASDQHHDTLAVQYESFDLSAHIGLLNATTNLLAIHGLNISLTSSDFLISSELLAVGAPNPDSFNPGFLQVPTPGMDNVSARINTGPGISELTENVPALADADDLTITARITPRQAGVGSVELQYRANYETPVALSMNDDGTGADVLANDGLYTAVIPASASTPGEMVRWAVLADDLDGNVSRWPVLVYALGQNESPEYAGTMVIDPAGGNSLSSFYWWTQDAAACHALGGRASAFYGDRFYDNVFARKRGGGAHKKSQKFDFNKGHEFTMNAEVKKVSEININDQAVDASYLRQSMGLNFHRETGNPGCFADFVEMRLNGAYERVGIMIEQVDDRYMERNDYDPEGDLYKFVQRRNLQPSFSDINWVEKKTGDRTDFGSLQVLIDQLHLSPAERRLYLYDHLDISEFINYFAGRVLLQHIDDVRKNFYMYYDAHGDGRWRIFPWDLDMTMGLVAGHNRYDPNRMQHPIWGIEELPTADGNDQWNRLYDAVYENLALRQMLLRRVRTLMDSHLIPPGNNGAGSWLNEYIAQEWPAVEPYCSGAYREPTISGKNSLISRIEVRRNDLFGTYSTSIPLFPGEVIPAAQTATPTILIGAIEFDPASGIQDEEYVELINTNAFAVDISNWTLSGGIDFTAHVGTVIPPGTTLFVVRDVAAFRSRILSPHGGEGRFMAGGYSGGLNNFGETLILSTPNGTPIHQVTYIGDPSDVQRYLRITELHFNPRAADLVQGDANVDNDEFEFIELMNSSDQPLDMSGAAFTEGIDYIFPAGTVLAPNARRIVVANQGAFESRYGTSLPIAGQYAGRLSNGGEEIELRDAGGGKVHSFTYQDSFTLFSDGKGSSMVVIDLDGNYSSGKNWKDSIWIGGSPGTSEPTTPPDIVINEILSHTDEPLIDTIELFNRSTQTVDLGGWLLGDATTDFRKYAFPAGTTMAPGAYLVLDEDDFNPTPLHPQSHHFSLNGAHGDDVWLIETATNGTLLRIVDHVKFDAAANGESLGRWLNGDGDLYPQSARSFGAENIGLRVGSIVVSEIMYHSPGNINALEFIEILNPTTHSEPLDHWQLKGAVDFAFPAGQVLAGGELIVLVDFDPLTDTAAATVFRNAYGIGSSVTLVGPFAGRLANEGENVRLFRADEPPLEEPDFYPELLEDEVRYDNKAPWSIEADLGTHSLTRIAASAWGNDPFSWKAAAPTPGNYTETTLVGYAHWRVSAFLPGTPAEQRDPLANPNGSQRSNLQEYAFVLDPVQSTNTLSFQLTFLPNQQLRLRHRRRINAPDLTYTIELSTNLIEWDDSETHLVEISQPLPLGDGLTEEVEFEIDPAIAFPPNGSTGFLRIRIDLAQP